MPANPDPMELTHRINDLKHRLMNSCFSDGAAMVAAHVLGCPAGAAATAEALLQCPRSQMRAHGLLAARLGGRTDLVLGTLLRCEPGVWKAAAVQISQVRENRGGTRIYGLCAWHANCPSCLV
jgi:uncharacterized protein YjeT (DUF2065 family)